MYGGAKIARPRVIIPVFPGNNCEYDSARAFRAAGAEAAMQCEQNTLNKLCNGITAINDSIKALDAVHQKAEALDGQEQANAYAHEVVPAMDTLRAAVDAMEEIVAADYWPVPTYDDILFYV